MPDERQQQKKREENQSLRKEKKYCFGKLQQLTPGWGKGDTPDLK